MILGHWATIDADNLKSTGGGERGGGCHPYGHGPLRLKPPTHVRYYQKHAAIPTAVDKEELFIKKL